MALYRSVFHGFYQGPDCPGVADHAERDRRIFANGSVRILQYSDKGVYDLCISYPGPADLIVGGHPAQCPGRVTSNDKIFVFETFDQRIDRGMSDGNQLESG